MSADTLLREVGLSREVIEDLDGRIPVARLLELWRVAALLSGDPDYGIHVAERVASPQTVHVVGFAARSARTLGEAIETAGRFVRVMNESTRFSLTRGPETSVLRVEPAPELGPWPRVYAEVVLAGYVRVGRLFAGDDLVCERATFQHAAPISRAAYERVFGTELAFGSPHNTLCFRTDALERPLPFADSELFAYFRDKAAAMLAHLARVESTSDRVREAIAARLVEAPSIATTARQLGTSARTLQRALRDEGTTFEELRDQVRRRIAIGLLKDRRMSLGEIAVLVGYSDGSAFRAAFRRWTDLSPRQARHHVLASDLGGLDGEVPMSARRVRAARRGGGELDRDTALTRATPRARA